MMLPRWSVLAVLLVAAMGWAPVGAAAAKGAEPAAGEGARAGMSNPFVTHASFRRTIDVRPLLKPVGRANDGTAAGPSVRPAALGRTVVPGGEAVSSGAPAPILSTDFAGLDDQNEGACTPAPGTPCIDPASSSVAVGPGDVVQVANQALLFSDRSGGEQTTVSSTDFFGALVPGATEEPRILYDQAHGRWLASESSWDCVHLPSISFIDLMVSRTADPHGLWDLYFVTDTTEFLALDSVGTSADKIGFGVDLGTLAQDSGCATEATPTGAGFIAIDWASLRVPPSGSFLVAGDSFTTWAHVDAAAMQGTGTDRTLYFVYQDISSGTPKHPFLAREIGSVIAGTATDFLSDLTGHGLAAFGSVIGVAQGPETLGGFGEGFDAAVVKGGHLWLSRTVSCTPTTDTQARDCVEVASLTAAAPPTAPALAQDFIVDAVGADDFMSGLAVDGNGTLHLMYSQETGGGDISDAAAYQRTVDPTGSLSAALGVRTSAAKYDGVTWGAFAGMAPDPTDSSVVWVGAVYADAGGGWSTRVGRLVVPADVTRLSGADRYDTSAAISAANFAPGVPAVFIASGLDFPDALTAASPAAMAGDPILLVKGTAASIPVGGPVDKELRRLAPTDIFVLGGTGSISAGIEAQLRGYVGGDVGHVSHVIRLFGPDRYATASAVALHFFTSAGGHAYVASGSNFPDSLAGAPAEAAHHAPLLLVTRTAVPVSTRTALTELAPSDITILGGPVAVSPAVESALAAFVGGDVTKVHRISGADRYETALDIARATFGAPPYTVFVATGTSFPDAMAGAAVAGHTGGPIILVGASLTADEQAEVTRLMTSHIYILGGPVVVSEAIRAALHPLLQ